MDWVADRLGVTPSTVTRWVKGDWPIPDRRAEELAELLGVPASQIRNAVADMQQNGPQSTQGQQPDVKEETPDAH